jgi:hypothetical protein
LKAAEDGEDDHGISGKENEVKNHGGDGGSSANGHPQPENALIKRRISAENLGAGDGEREGERGIVVAAVKDLVYHRTVVKVSVVGRNGLGGKSEEEDFPEKDEGKNQPWGVTEFRKRRHG